MDTKSKKLVTLGLLLAFTVALPLFVWGIITQRFELREEANVAPTCQPRPDCLDATPHPCEITEPDEGWCPTGTTSPTATSSAKSSPTSSPKNTATGAPIGGPQGEPNSCGGTCGSKYNCGANLFCFIADGETSGFCRNPICPTDTDCACSTPSPTPKSTPKKTSSPSPTPTMTIVYLTSEPSASPSATPTPMDSSGVLTPEVAGTKPNLNFLLYIAAGSFFLSMILFIISLMKTKKGFAPLALILAVALPVFVWAVATGNFNINKRAASGEPTPTTTPRFSPTPTPRNTPTATPTVRPSTKPRPVQTILPPPIKVD